MPIPSRDLREVARDPNGPTAKRFTKRELAREALDARRETLELEAEQREQEPAPPELDGRGRPKLEGGERETLDWMTR